MAALLIYFGFLCVWSLFVFFSIPFLQAIFDSIIDKTCRTNLVFLMLFLFVWFLFAFELIMFSLRSLLDIQNFIHWLILNS